MMEQISEARTETLSYSIINWTLSECKAEYERHGAGLTDAQLRKRTATIDELVIAPHVFQPRASTGRSKWNQERHAKNLGTVLTRGDKLDPVTVFPVAGKLIVVDGHSRLEAYRLRGRRQVRITFNGDAGKQLDGFGVALAYSLSSNAKDKLPYEREEKCEGAWRLVNDASLSQREVSRVAGVALSTVQLMAKAAREQPETQDMTWAEVKSNRRANHKRRDDWEDIHREKLVRRLRDEFGSFPDKSPDLFLEAVKQAYPRVAEMVDDEIATQVEEVIEEGSDF